MDPALSGLLVGGALVFFRIAGLMVVAPVLAARTVPAPIRAAITLLLTALLLPTIPPVPEWVALTPMVLVAEMVVGIGLGIGAALLIGGAELAGDVLAVQTGLAGATALDPLTGMGTGILGQFLSLFVLTLLLATGGHLIMIEALAASYEIVPVGAAFDVGAGVHQVARMFSVLFAQGLQFAAPIIAAVSVGYVALGVLARTSPQLNMLAVAFPLQIGLGLIILAGALPLGATFYAAWPVHIEGLAGRFMNALVGF